jgi:hypothetical protein
MIFLPVVGRLELELAQVNPAACGCPNRAIASHAEKLACQLGSNVAL